jgi:hypothetical protein
VLGGINPNRLKVSAMFVDVEGMYFQLGSFINGHGNLGFSVNS